MESDTINPMCPNAERNFSDFQKRQKRCRNVERFFISSNTFNWSNSSSSASSYFLFAISLMYEPKIFFISSWFDFIYFQLCSYRVTRSVSSFVSQKTYDRFIGLTFTNLDVVGFSKNLSMSTSIYQDLRMDSQSLEYNSETKVWKKAICDYYSDVQWWCDFFFLSLPPIFYSCTDVWTFYLSKHNFVGTNAYFPTFCAIFSLFSAFYCRLFSNLLKRNVPFFNFYRSIFYPSIFVMLQHQYTHIHTKQIE